MTKPRTVRRAGLTLILAGAAVVTSACANGKEAQTSNEHPSIDGVNSQAGNILLRGVVIQTPPNGSYTTGDDAQLTAVFVNSGGTTDTLTGISGPGITDWGSFASAAEAQSFIAAQSRGAGAGTTSSASSPSASTSSTPINSTSPSPGTSKSARGNPTSTAAGPASTSSSVGAPLALPRKSITIDSGASVSFGTPSSTEVLLLEDFKAKAIYPGQSVTLQFTFAKAGSIDVQVPVGLSTDNQNASVPAPSSSANGG